MGAVQRVTLELPVKDAENFKKLSKKDKQLFIKILSSLINDEELEMKTAMDFISSRAQKRGLTPEILQQILQEENP